MRAFERFVRWNVSDNVKVAVCVSVIMAMSVAPHVGACNAVCVPPPPTPDRDAFFAGKITKPGEGLFAQERPQFIREAEQRAQSEAVASRLGLASADDRSDDKA